MKTKGWIVAGALAAAAVVSIKGGCLSGGEDPDERIAGRLTDMCKIARKNLDTPERGVRALGKYLDKHAGDLLGDWGETLAAIERIGDDRKHDQRAYLARERISKPVRDCAGSWNDFGEAVANDPAASALVDRFGARLSRTFEIIFSGAHVDFLHLPQQLERML